MDMVDMVLILVSTLIWMLIAIALNMCLEHMSKYMSDRRITKKTVSRLYNTLTTDDLKLWFGENLPKWTKFPVSKQAECLNALVSKMWPFVADAAEDIVKKSLELSIDEYKPKGFRSMKIKKVSLGTVAPRITGIRNESFTEGQFTMDIDFQWGGDPIIAVGAKILCLPSIPIQLKNIKSNTVLRVVFLLVDEIPRVSAVAFSLVPNRIPLEEVAYSVKPKMSDDVEFIIPDTLQWPHRIVVPIVDRPGDKSDLELDLKGEFTVTVVNATNIVYTRLLTRFKPYVVLYIRPQFKVRTNSVDDDLNPIWNQTFKLLAEEKGIQELTLEVFGKELLEDQLLGIAQLSLEELKEESPKRIQLSLGPSIGNHKKLGEITIEVSYHEFNTEEQAAAVQEEKMILEYRRILEGAKKIQVKSVTRWLELWSRAIIICWNRCYSVLVGSPMGKSHI